MKNQFRFWRYLLLMLVIVIVSGVSYAMAVEVWVGPGTNPPDGNRSRPVDTSNELQTKTGGLRLQDYLIIGATAGGGIAPGIDNDTFWVSPSAAGSGSNLGIIGAAQIQGITGGVIDLDASGVSILRADGNDLSNTAIFAQNNGLGWSGYFSGAPVGIEKYLIVGAVPGGVPAIGNGYFSGDLYVGGGVNKLCLNGSDPADCISSFADVGADLWQQGLAGKIYYNNGNVGVGTSTPAEKMEIAYPGAGVARLRVTDVDVNENPEIQLQYGAGINDHWALYVSKANSDNLQLWINGNDRLAIDQNGNVGIGTMFPKAKLDVWGLFKTQQAVTDELKINDVAYNSFHNSLWVGRDLGNISVCASAEGGCDNVIDLVGDSNITAAAVLNGRLFLGLSNGHLLSCDDKPVCSDLGAILGGSINAITIFANKLWIGMSSQNTLYSCDTSGVCASHAVNANESFIKASAVYDGKLWLVSGKQLFSCATSGICQLAGSYGQQNFNSLAVYDGNLWLGNSSGKLWQCGADGSCAEQAPNAGATINVMTVFAGKLWLGLSNSKIYACDSAANCASYNAAPAGQVKSLAVFNGFLWVGVSSGKLAYCTTQGVCADDYDLDQAVNVLLVYDYPSRACNAFSRTFNQCLPDVANPLDAVLESEADYVRPSPQPNTGECVNGAVIIHKTDCGNDDPNDPLAQDNYCGLKCPVGTNYVSGGGCKVLDEFRSVNGKVQRYFNYGNSPKKFSDGSFGWECQVTKGHVLEVDVICQGNFVVHPFDPTHTNPCN